MQIFIETEDGRTLPVEVRDRSTTTIGEIRADIEACVGLPIQQFYLIFGGKRVEDGRTPSDYNIQEQSRLQLRPEAVKKPTRPGEGTRDRGTTSAEDSPESRRRKLKEACDASAEALIIEFYQLENTTFKPAWFCTMQYITNGGIKRSFPIDRGAPQFRWIHLPANNPAWVEAVLNDLFDEIAESEKQRTECPELLLQPVYQATRHQVHNERPGLVQFVKPSYYTVFKDPVDPDPFYTPLEVKRVHSSLFMPYIESESKKMQDQRKSRLVRASQDPVASSVPDLDDKWRKLPLAARLLTAYGFGDHPVHERRTLDQAFYYTMPTSKVWIRDDTQVLSRFSTSKSLLMVDQLWMWVIDAERKREDGSLYNVKTIVTAFWGKPHSQDSSEKGKEPAIPGDALDQNEQAKRINAAKEIPDCRGRILSALYGNYACPVVTYTDLICLIIDKCTGFLHPTPQEAKCRDMDCLDPFVVGIGECASTQTDLASSLSDHSKELQRLLREKNRMQRQSLAELFSDAQRWRLPASVDEKIDEEIEELSDITKETECLEKIKDIIDELNSISHFFIQQISVVQTMANDAALQNRIHSASAAAAQDTREPGRERTTGEDSEATTSQDIIPKGPGSSASPPAARKRVPAHQIIQDSFKDMKMKYTELVKTLERRNKTIEDLKSQALRVYKDLCDILDLKQKQATVSQALSARQESKEAEKQGQTILLFTIVTIIFLPPSFIAAIFSMNATEITGGDVVRPISQIFSIMFPVTAGVLIISLVLAYTNSLKYFTVNTWRLLSSAWK